MRLGDRPVGELVVLVFVGTVCAGVFALTLTIAIIALVQPERDIERAFATVASGYSSLLAALAGYLTGRSHANGRHARSSSSDDSESARFVERGRGTDPEQ